MGGVLPSNGDRREAFKIGTSPVADPFVSINTDADVSTMLIEVPFAVGSFYEVSKCLTTTVGDSYDIRYDSLVL